MGPLLASEMGQERAERWWDMEEAWVKTLELLSYWLSKIGGTTESLSQEMKLRWARDRGR